MAKKKNKTLHSLLPWFRFIVLIRAKDQRLGNCLYIETPISNMPHRLPNVSGQFAWRPIKCFQIGLSECPKNV